MKRILIIPMGSADPAILNTISTSLEKTFHCMVETGAEMPIPLTSHDSRRNQYYSTAMLETLRGMIQRDGDRVLGVADADLFVPELNFVFGEADASAGVAVISLTRLRQEFYGLRRSTRLFHDRAVKEAIHELGHTYGLGHCRDPHCIMHFSNSLRDTDEKGPEFCARCKKIHSMTS
jgi:archaemetzincin